MSILGNLQVAL